MGTLLLRKMLNNFWLVVCLLGGSILSVALISSIPTYTDGVLQRLLTKDLESFQRDRQLYPGRTTATRNFYSGRDNVDRWGPYRSLDEQITDHLAPLLGLPVREKTQQITLDYLFHVQEGPLDRLGRPTESKRFIRVESMENLAEHARIVHGRQASSLPQDGVYEVMATEKAVRDLQLTLGETYEMVDLLDGGTVITVRLVGIFTIKDTRDLFWFNGLGVFDESILLDHDTMLSDFVRQQSHNLTYVRWFFGFDYYSITITNIGSILQQYAEFKRMAKEQRVDLVFPAITIMEEYLARAKVLKITLAFLQLPVVLVLVFFIYMVAQLIVENDRNEIAVLQSRGAARDQIFALYFLEGLVLSGVALLLGPPLGLFLSQALGAANGFLEFVQRSALPLFLSRRSYAYAAAGAAIFMATMLVPAFFASRVSIVAHKSGRARAKRPIWKRLYLDLFLIGIAVYGLYSYRTQQQVLAISGLEGSQLPIDPLLFVISVLFILGCGLAALRFFPVMVRVIFRFGRNRWSPALYAAFIQIGRSLGHEQFLMIFLILAMALGIYGSTAARTINRNIAEKVFYRVGADLSVRPHFANDAPPPPEVDDLGAGGPQGLIRPGSRVQYQEPPFLPFTQLTGVAQATKVLRKNRVSLSLPAGARASAALVGIIPHEFGKIAWFRTDLLPIHWYHYLNVLTQSPKAILLSTSLAEDYDIRLGDSVLVTWSGQEVVDTVVHGFVDYWPSFNPHAEREGGDRPHLVVANLSYIQAKMAMEPYEIWLSKQADATSADIFASMEQRQLEIEGLADATLELVEEKNDPMLQGTNGVLTLGFLVTSAVAFAGFVIYWILSLQARELQFGILRAMGLPQNSVMMMVITEQLLISAAAIVIGILIGRIAGVLFIPLLQLVYSSYEQVPPFRVVSLRADSLRIYAVAASMLISGAVLFRILIGKIRIHQALKLGED